MYGIEHVYATMDEADHAKREEAQEFCRGV
jgi:hypothetical protein